MEQLKKPLIWKVSYFFARKKATIILRIFIKLIVSFIHLLWCCATHFQNWLSFFTLPPLSRMHYLYISIEFIQSLDSFVNFQFIDKNSSQRAYNSLINKSDLRWSLSQSLYLLKFKPMKLTRYVVYVDWLSVVCIELMWDITVYAEVDWNVQLFDQRDAVFWWIRQFINVD